MLKVILILALVATLSAPVSASYAEDFMARSCIINIDGTDIAAEIQLVPDYILQKFVNLGWTLTIDRRRCVDWGEEHRPGWIVTGLTHYGEKEIIIGHAPVVLHEFGHFYQHHLGRGWEPELEELYQLEAGKAVAVLGEYAAADWREYFAQAFACYLRDPEGLRAVAPETAGLLDELAARGWSKW